MKLLKLAFCLTLALSFVACDKDDDVQKDCTQSDWVGVYEGTMDCAGTVEDVTVTITASGSNDIIVEYETATVITEYDPLTPDNCDLDHSESALGITFTVDATLNNDELNFKEITSFGGVSSTCEIQATRQ